MKTSYYSLSEEATEREGEREREGTKTIFVLLGKDNAEWKIWKIRPFIIFPE